MVDTCTKRVGDLLSGPVQVLPRRIEVDSCVCRVVEECGDQKSPWYNRTVTYFCVLVVLLFLSIFFVIFPLPYVDKILAMAPITNMAEKRYFTMKATAYLARELVLSDQFTWLSRSELTSALQFYYNEFVNIDKAIRGGGGYGIQSGMDSDPEHSKLMYGVGCWWRNESQKAAATAAAYESGALVELPCYYTLRDEAVAQGLANLYGNYADAIKSIIGKYGVVSEEADKTWNTTDASGFTEVLMNTTDYSLVGHVDSISDQGAIDMDVTEADESIAFILQVWALPN